jgi:GDPmannose 4,6-dehydratase
MKRALITGVTGQDGSYLAEFLLGKGYKVFGLTRRSSTVLTDRISHILDKVELITGDLLDQVSLNDAVKISQPDEVYNLAAQSFVHSTWAQPTMSAEYTAVGTTRLLEAVRQLKPDSRFYQASSSEMFGRVETSPQNETTNFCPRTPYGVAKLFSHWMTVNYRDTFKMFASSGILFNHESPRRGLEFVTRKITYQVAMIKQGLAKELVLGSLDARRDWGFAGDYVEAMWMMLQHEKPEDFVIASGKAHSVRDVVTTAFERADLDWNKYVRLDDKFARGPETNLLVGDCAKAQRILGWTPKTDFKALIHMMVDADIDLVRRRN